MRSPTIFFFGALSVAVTRLPHKYRRRLIAKWKQLAIDTATQTLRECVGRWDGGKGLVLSWIRLRNFTYGNWQLAMTLTAISGSTMHMWPENKLCTARSNQHSTLACRGCRQYPCRPAYHSTWARTLSSPGAWPGGTTGCSPGFLTADVEPHRPTQSFSRQINGPHYIDTIVYSFIYHLADLDFK